VGELFLVSRLYGFSLLHLDYHTHVLLLIIFPITIHALVNEHLGIRVADLLIGRLV